MIADFEVVSRQKVERVYPNGCHFATIAGGGPEQGDLIRGWIPGPVTVGEIIVFRADFEGKPVFGGMFVTDKRVDVVDIKVESR